MADVADLDALMAALQTEDAAAAMKHDGVHPDSLVFLVESYARGRRAMARCAFLVVALAVVGTAAGSAWASFPGRNGKIVYGWVGESAFRTGPHGDEHPGR